MLPGGRLTPKRVLLAPDGSGAGPIEFAKPRITEKAFDYVRQSLESGHLAGDGPFTAKCHEWLTRQLGSAALLTHSCTAALEMSAILAGIGPGDEVILPSYTF